MATIATKVSAVRNDLDLERVETWIAARAEWLITKNPNAPLQEISDIIASEINDLMSRATATGGVGQVSRP